MKKTTKKTPSKLAHPMEALLAKSSSRPQRLKRGDLVEGKITEIGHKTLSVDIGSKSDALVKDLEFELAGPLIKTLKVGEKITGTVLISEGKTGQPLLSLRSQAEKFIWSALQEKLEKGTPVECKVESFNKNGLVASIYSLPAFIPTSHFGQVLSANPNQVIGKTIKTKIIEIDKTRTKIILSEKAISEADSIQKQENALRSIKKGDKFLGRVTGIVSFGAFVQIMVDNVPLEGLLHISQMAWRKIEDPAQIVTQGQEIEVVVIGIEESRLALSLKKLQKDPWKNTIEKYKQDTHIKGTITKVGDFGAFVLLEPGVEGLLRLSKIPPSTRLAVGEKINCFVEEVDKERRKISLSVVLKEKPIGYK